MKSRTRVVNGSTGGKENSLEIPALLQRQHDIHRAFHVAPNRVGWMVVAIRNVVDGSEMEEQFRLKFPKNVTHRLGIKHAASCHRDLPAPGQKFRRMAGKEIVIDQDLMASTKQ